MFFALIILGIVQGVAEFLPISSSGHLVLLSDIFGIKESLFVSIILHVATLLSIIVVYRKDVLYYLRHPFSDGVKKIIIATIPTGIIALILLPLIEKSFSGNFLPICFLITAVLLVFTELFFNGRQVGDNKITPDFEGINYKQALIIGIAQGLAVFPGVSRSGSTICVGLMAGGNKNEVANFSFIMSIPIIILSLIKEIYDIAINKDVININIYGLILGGLFAFIIGIFAIKLMKKLTQKIHFLWFGIYLVLIAILTFFI